MKFGSIFKGFKTVGKVAKVAALDFTGIRGMGTFWMPKSYVDQVSMIKKSAGNILRSTSSSKRGDVLKIAKASANLLGKGSGIVMSTRLLRGRNPVKDKSGRVNVPFIPFI